MSKKIMVSLLVISTGAMSSLTLAAPWQDDHRPVRYHEKHRMGPPDGHYSRSHHKQDVRQWHRGDRLPPHFREKRYRVDNWRAHHLPRPPHGHRWVNVNGDYILVAVASGIITSILLHH
ncbi:RcnB family protein [Acinetobacter qingfengensis]|nr:RcnB family protein [Acinetobacter qingfengensis]